MTAGPTGTLEALLAAQEDRLLACVHCGFCLPACPTYVRLGDEADSPRGRLHLMRAVGEGRLDPAAAAFQEHMDRCLGCRACETVCPSGVEYGHLLEVARERAAAARPPKLLARALPVLLATPTARAVLLWFGRLLRATRLPRLLARHLPRRGPWGTVALGMGMLAASAPVRIPGVGSVRAGVDRGGREGPPPEGRDPAASPPAFRVALLDGCVQAGLFGRVNRASERVLSAAGHSCTPAPGQGCCGALHAHSGDLEGARRLARRNIAAFEESGAEVVAVNAAGCGAAMKEYGTLLAGDREWSDRAREIGRRVRDLSEVLSPGALPVGAPLPLRVTWDAPCHLLHAQGIEEPPLALLRAIPGLELIPLAGASECCGGAGIYAITHPSLGGEIGGDKASAILASGADVVATSNPGCIMQIGGELLARGSAVRVLHPIELIDESLRRGGVYSGASDGVFTRAAEDLHA
jgi:glycolate oxidase iron-sulfur subunit